MDPSSAAPLAVATTEEPQHMSGNREKILSLANITSYLCLQQKPRSQSCYSFCDRPTAMSAAAAAPSCVCLLTGEAPFRWVALLLLRPGPLLFGEGWG